MTGVARETTVLRSVPVAAWLICVVMTAAPSQLVPGLDPDESWRLALNLRQGEGTRYGTDVVFTYGPWGFLDYPNAVDPLNVALGTGFAVACVSFTWWTFWRVLRKSIGRDLAAAIAAGAIIVVASPLGVSNLLLVGLIGVLALSLVDSTFTRISWLPATAAAVGAFLLQVKLSVGICALGAALVASVFAPGKPCRRTAECLAGGTIAFVAAWLAAGQAVGDLPTWFARSFEVVSGYSEAMGTAPPDPWRAYGLAAAVVLVAGVALWRAPESSSGRAGWGLGILAVLTAYYGYRQGFGRYDPVHHRPVFYVAVLPFVLWVIAARPRSVTRWAVLCLVLVLGRNGGQVLQPGQSLDRWQVTARAVIDRDYRTELLDRARAAGRLEAGLSPTVRAALGSAASLSVDGYSIGVGWMEGRPLSGPPVLQSYAAYTHDLDELNAAWLRQAPPGHLILRPVATAIDGRNSLWDPPSYVLEELCRTRVVIADPRWMLLAREPSQCGEPAELRSSHVRAGETVNLPAATTDAIVVMSFEPDPPHPARFLADLLAANSPPLYATVDGQRYRLPRALAGGPLIASVPRAVGWPASHGGNRAYGTVTFNEGGIVRLRAIPIVPREQRAETFAPSGE